MGSPPHQEGGAITCREVPSRKVIVHPVRVWRQTGQSPWRLRTKSPTQVPHMTTWPQGMQMALGGLAMQIAHSSSCPSSAARAAQAGRVGGEEWERERGHHVGFGCWAACTEMGGGLWRLPERELDADQGQAAADRWRLGPRAAQHSTAQHRDRRGCNQRGRTGPTNRGGGDPPASEAALALVLPPRLACEPAWAGLKSYPTGMAGASHCTVAAADGGCRGPAGIAAGGGGAGW